MRAPAIFARMFDESDLASIREARADWERETLDPVLEGYGERRDRFATVSNHEVDRLYTPGKPRSSS